MNRRDFVKALAGVPLLGLLVKLPKVEDECQLTSEDNLWFEATQNSTNVEGQPPWSITVVGVDISDHVESWRAYTGKTIFVDLVSGDDANDGLSPEAPVTWEKAWFETAEPVDMYLLLP